MKRIISLLLCITMVLSLCPIVMSAATEVIVDNTDNGFELSGEWTSSVSVAGSKFYGSNYFHDGNTGKSEDKWAKWTPDLPEDGTYEVYMMWASHNNRSTEAPVEIVHKNGTEEVIVNQKTNGNTWNELGKFEFNKGTNGYVKIIATADGYTVADAVKFVLSTDTGDEVENIIIDNMDEACTFVNAPGATGETGDGVWRTGDSVGGFYGSNYATTDTNVASEAYVTAKATLVADGKYNINLRWSSAGNRTSAAPVTLDIGGETVLETTVDQTKGANSWNLLGTYDLTEGTEVTVTVYASSSGYTTFDAVMIEHIPDFDVVNVGDHQVYQREIGGTSASVPVSARNSDETVTSIKARVLTYDTEETVVDWFELVTDTTTGVITKNVTVPQGGWYKTEIAAYDEDDKLLKNTTSDIKWGVGIVILCAGQSNMEGHGRKPYFEADDLVANFNKGNTWQHLEDPYAGNGGSMAPGLGNALVKKYGIPVAFVPTAVGGMGLCYGSGNPPSKVWSNRNEENPADTSTLYGNSIARARAAGGVELIIWNQGETDVRFQENDMSVYLDTFKELVEYYRTDLYSDIPVFVVQSGTHDVTETIKNDDAYSALRTMQLLSDLQIDDVYMGAAQLEFDRVDDAHFSTTGMNKVGQRVANTIMYHYGDADYYRGPQIESAKFANADNTTIDLSVKHEGGDALTSTTEGMLTGFTVVAGEKSYEVTNAVLKDADTITLTLAEAPTEDVFVRYMYGVNPDISNFVYDNSSLVLPLECTPYDLEVAAFDGEDEEKVNYGDVNDDGVIDISDVVSMIEYVGTKSIGEELDTEMFPDGTFPGGEKSAKLTADDIIDISDIVLLIEYIGTKAIGEELDPVKFPGGTFPGASL